MHGSTCSASVQVKSKHMKEYYVIIWPQGMSATFSFLENVEYGTNFETDKEITISCQP